MIIDKLYRATVYATLGSAALLTVVMAAMVIVLWPIWAALAVSHTLCGAACLIVQRRGRTITRDVCDYFGDEIEARKLADQRADVNFVRIEKAWAKRRARALPALPMPAESTRPEIVVGADPYPFP